MQLEQRKQVFVQNLLIVLLQCLGQIQVLNVVTNNITEL